MHIATNDVRACIPHLDLHLELNTICPTANDNNLGMLIFGMVHIQYKYIYVQQIMSQLSQLMKQVLRTPLGQL